jgi:hypothetical protein
MVESHLVVSESEINLDWSYKPQGDQQRDFNDMPVGLNRELFKVFKKTVSAAKKFGAPINPWFPPSTNAIFLEFFLSVIS